MGANTFKQAPFLLVLALTTFHMIHASYPDITSDFIVPLNATVVDGNFFTHTALCALVDADIPATFKVFKLSMAEFPALSGQSVSYAVLTFPADSVNPPHTHPRSAELLFLLGGALEVGFVDTTYKLYAQTLQADDIFVFPKHLVHYQYNMDAKNPAIVLSAFGSANAWTVSVPGAVFNSTIDDGILAKSFKTDVATVQKIKAGLAPKV